MNTTTDCLNCHRPLHEKYCGNCGQKASTHRFSLKHIFSHDMIHSMFHLDKGILFTIKSLFSKPGHSIRAYVQGERAKHFSYFTLMIFLLGIQHLLMPYVYDQAIAQVQEAEVKSSMSVIQDFNMKNPKISLLFVPVVGLVSLLWFRRAKLNYAEHLVLNAYRMSAELIISIVLLLVTIPFHSPQLYNAMSIVLSIVTVVYAVWFYCQYFSVFGYSKAGLLIRSILCVLTVPLLASLFIGILMMLRIKGFIQ